MSYNVICLLPNASNLINGVVFADRDGGGVITDPPVEEEEAAQFRDIPGYEVIEIGARVPPVVTAEGAELQRGRPSREQVAAWTKEIEDLGGELPEGVKGKAVAEFLAALKGKLEADRAAAEQADRGDVEVEEVVEPVVFDLSGLAAIADVDLTKVPETTKAEGVTDGATEE